MSNYFSAVRVKKERESEKLTAEVRHSHGEQYYVIDYRSKICLITKKGKRQQIDKFITACIRIRKCTFFN